MSLNTHTLLKADPSEYTILIVDDNPTNLGFLSDSLESYGFNTVIARNGETTLERINYIKPNLILLDIMMPGIDGFETCRRLKANNHTKDIPVIFMTALSETESKIKGFKVGAIDYVTKPLQEEEVLVRVATHLNIRDLAQNLQQQNTILSKRTLQLETSRQVAQQITSILDLDELLTKVVCLIQLKFNYYFVGIWLLTEQQDTIVLQTKASEEKTTPLKPGFHIPLNTPFDIITQVFNTKQAQTINNIHTKTKSPSLSTLPKTQSELALPLQVGPNIIGVLNIQSNQPTEFSIEDKDILQMLANQIAIAIRNAKLYELEKNLRHLEEKKRSELAQLNADKDKFFSIVSHDLRNPFTSLLGHNELMLTQLEKLSKQDIKRMLKKNHKAATIIHSLLNNLLTWVSIQRGQMIPQPIKINLKQLTQNTIDLLTTTANQKNIQLINNIKKKITVYADKNMLDTVIRNLASNALKFTPAQGQVTLSAQTINSQFIEITIKDTGIGIKPNNLKKLFKIGQQYSTSGTNNEKGTGLGLIICKEMIERNGGRISIDSVPQQGTSVKFTVPISL